MPHGSAGERDNSQHNAARSHRISRNRQRPRCFPKDQELAFPSEQVRGSSKLCGSRCGVSVKSTRNTLPFRFRRTKPVFSRRTAPAEEFQIMVGIVDKVVHRTTGQMLVDAPDDQRRPRLIIRIRSSLSATQNVIVSVFSTVRRYFSQNSRFPFARNLLRPGARERHYSASDSESIQPPRVTPSQLQQKRSITENQTRRSARRS